MKSERPLESTFQRRVLRKLKTLPNIWFFKASDRVRSGIPDIIMCLNGQFIAMELKRGETEKPTPLQMHTLSQIIKAQGEGWIVTPENWDQIWEMLIMSAGAMK